jgi:hypothetical protein
MRQLLVGAGAASLTFTLASLGWALLDRWRPSRRILWNP